MELGLEQNALSMYALERQQAMISHNLACSTVRGYQSKVSGFSGKRNGIIAFPGVQPASSIKPTLQISNNTLPGSIERTAIPTDVAIQGNGFFKVQDNLGNVSFTRNGSFHFNESGVLCDYLNRQVIADGGTIQAENNGDPIFINRNGQVFEGDQELGTLTAYTLPEFIAKNPGGSYTANEIAGTQLASVSFESGYLEQSNVSPIHEMVQMIQVSNAHEANRNMIKQLDNELGEAIQVLGTTNG